MPLNLPRQPIIYIHPMKLSATQPEHNHTESNTIIIILGSGPNRIGQGIEFDYCCVQAVQSGKRSWIYCRYD